jgi:predicted ABC-type ATPase
LATFDPDRAAVKAGRLMLQEIHGYARCGESFVFKTTLSGRGYSRLIPSWRADGYMLKLFFLRLASADLAIARVRQRVREGGHDVPESTIRRRFTAGLNNFDKLYRSIVNEWALYDNSGSEPQLIEDGENP